MQEVLFNNIQERLISDIKKSTTGISIAVAWFNNKNLFDCLIERAKAGLQIELIIVNDEINNRAGGLDFQSLIDNDAVRFYFAKSRGLMHHKFCVIDNKVVFNGSYNWTYAAIINTTKSYFVLLTFQIVD